MKVRESRIVQVGFGGHSEEFRVIEVDEIDSNIEVSNDMPLSDWQKVEAE